VLTQGELADRLAVSQGFVSQVEKDTKALPREVADRACREFDLPGSFFAVGSDVEELGVATFRKSAKASIRDEQHVKALHSEASRLFRLASQASGYHHFDLSGLAMDDEEDAASKVRALLGIGPVDPIPNVTRALERLGVGVIHVLDPLDDEKREHNGISRPHRLNDRPVIATVGDQPPAVLRMTLLHELGHLIYDSDLSTPIRSTRAPEEARAFRFAGAMLVPGSVIRQGITETLRLHGYLRVKADYGITASALIHRARDIGAISPARQRSLYIQHSSQGWRHNEPVDVAAEQPRLLARAAHRALADTPGRIAVETGVPEALVRHWLGVPPRRPALAPVITLARRAPK